MSFVVQLNEERDKSVTHRFSRPSMFGKRGAPQADMQIKWSSSGSPVKRSTSQDLLLGKEGVLTYRSFPTCFYLCVELSDSNVPCTECIKFGLDGCPVTTDLALQVASKPK